MSFENDLGLKLRAAYLSFHRRAQATLAPHGLTADQFVVLSLLAEKDGIRQRDLVAAMSSDSSTIGAMLKILDDRRLIKRVPSNTDRRSTLVYLTSKGLNLQGRLTKLVAEIRSDLKYAVPDDTRGALLNGLDRISEVMKPPPNGSEKRS